MVKRKRKRTPRQIKAIFARFAKKYKKGLNKARVESSNLHSVGYEPISRILEVRFRRKKGSSPSIYRYANVPPQVHQKLLKSSSHGRFFHKNIRSKFPFTRVS